jgi:hypothetical protein
MRHDEQRSHERVRHVEGYRELLAQEAVKWARNAGPTPSGHFRRALAEQLAQPILEVRVFVACLSYECDSA